MEVYLDNAATTQTDPKVFEAMIPYFTKEFGNPSSFHSKGLEALKILNNSRKKISKILNCEPEEIIFTGSGTESDNLAILGYARKNQKKGKHIITTKIEHHAVLDSFQKLEKEGFQVTYLDVDSEGFINIKDIEKSINKDTILISIIYANNEIGVIQNISEISKLCKKKKIIFHTDACQAANYLDIDVKNLGIDMMTLNGSKIYGPKGIGILYKKKNIEIEPIIHGGGQEFGIRSGTENIANIVGFTKALEISQKNKKKESKKLTSLRNFMIKELLKIEDTKLNGPLKDRLPNNVNVSFLNIEGESIILRLNEKEIFAATGSACSSKNLDPSHVILALGMPHEIAHSSIRFSFGNHTTKKQIEYTLKSLKKIVEDLRKMSPLNYKLKTFILEKKNG